MIRFRPALLTLLLLWPLTISAHEVPDHVQISMFVKPENGRLLILVRMPANALIDFLLPTLPVGNWVDLANADADASAGANVWIADMLSLRENGASLARPQVRAVRLSRVNDPSFNTFQDALNRVNGAPLPVDTLVLQEQITVDTLLDTPISAAGSRFSFEPRFARLGVVVDTTVSFLPPDGGIQRFQFQDDPEPFELNPGSGYAFSRFVKAGIGHYVGGSDYLVFGLCVALVFRRFRRLLPFAIALVCAESLVLLAALASMPPVPWLRVVIGVLIAATTVYLGIEAIIAGRRDRLGLAIISGLIAGGGFWLGLQPLVQFGGTHHVIAGLAFNLGLVIAELATMALILVALRLVMRLSRAPRATIMFAAGLAIHVSWRRLLDRADALTLVPIAMPVINPAMIIVIAAVAVAALAGLAYRARRGPGRRVVAART